VPLQSQVWQKHCVLVAASNPHRLPTPVVRPPVTARMQTSATGEPQAEQWWLADAETVAKAFPLCQVSLSIIAPRQLPLLRHVYNGVCVHSCLLFLMIDGLYFPIRQSSFWYEECCFAIFH
jgi:hypothetical protein